MATEKTKIIEDKKGRLWVTCGDCGQLIRYDKPILGSLHFCLTEEERLAKKYKRERELGDDD